MMVLDMRALAVGLVLAAVAVVPAQADVVSEVIQTLNDTKSVRGSETAKSYPVLFDAYLELDPPPMTISNGYEGFNHNTIHPEMQDWQAVAGWAESNAGMAEAMLAAVEHGKVLFGLPYGADNVDEKYREAGLVAEIAVGGSLRDNRFRYLDAIRTITAFGTAEAYRRLEAGDAEGAFDLTIATIMILRQTCDREFVLEQLTSMDLLSETLSNLRDMMYLYGDKIDPDLFRRIGHDDLPFLRPDRTALLMPEGDRVIAEAMINEVFDAQGQPDRERFADTFAAIQSTDAPLTRFGAAKRWRMIADVHDSLESSQQRLTDVYDDWFRRWRVQDYDPILDVPTQFDRTNAVRFAAVIYSMQDIEELFVARNSLQAAVWGTAMSAGIAGYNRQLGNYPSDTEKTYALFARKKFDTDPFDFGYAPFKYRVLDSDFKIDSQIGRLNVERGTGVLYSLGQDNEDGRGEKHSENGWQGDMVLWPPMKTIARQQGLID